MLSHSRVETHIIKCLVNSGCDHPVTMTVILAALQVVHFCLYFVQQLEMK